MRTPTLLCVLDGFGLNPNPRSNAVHSARKPNFDRLWRDCPHTTLITYGERVGLPEGQMGNSEVGHLNIGAGRVIEQWLLRISRALQGTALDSNQTYRSFVKGIANSEHLHLIGLLSDGGVHSHEDHLKLLLKRLKRDYQGEVLLHILTDGRDTAPQSGIDSLSSLQEFLKDFPRVRIATVCGRFYAMDRDKRWERTQLAYQAILGAQGTKCRDFVAGLRASYESKVGDEFVEPLVGSYSGYQTGDAFVFWNFREDRMRQIVAAICSREFSGFARTHTIPAAERVLCFTEYDHSLHLPYLFEPLCIKNHIGEYLAGLGRAQLRVAETEKYPHVTYFFNGGVEQAYTAEERKLVPSPRDVRTYDLKPEMSAAAVTDIVVAGIQSGKFDFIVVNLANCDMVGHTGVFEAAVKAVETVDQCLGRMLEALKTANGQALIIADHGNAEQMVDYETAAPHTSHTTFPVPCVLVRAQPRAGESLRDGGALCDVAPTLLKMMETPQPPEMSGTSLLVD
ncbi:MAG: 2,3-bisphosphoglycerate-independent phosphoglycerate mutase [Oligoflexia bacterium]|nr:2,3-bisphosphoglycerate-independent phosphoglycerate mutase [Oligoflexia bacterium]